MTRDLVHSDIDFSILASLAANMNRNGIYECQLSKRRFQYRRGRKEERTRERKRARTSISCQVSRVHISIRPAGFLLFRRPCSPVVTTRRSDSIFDPRGTRWRKSRLSFLHIHIHTYIRDLLPVLPVAKRDFPSRCAREFAVETARALSKLSLDCHILSGWNDGFGWIRMRLSAVDHSWHEVNRVGLKSFYLSLIKFLLLGY